MSQKHFLIILSFLVIVIFLIRLSCLLSDVLLLNGDAISSVQAARSIIETGVPARNGIFYPRDYLAHYLLAGSIFLIGDNSLGYATPNLIFSVLVLILLYFTARILTKNKIVIFLTILFVSTSLVENAYAINPRSYMQFQFFFLLTVFCFYKGFVEKNKLQNKKYRILTLFSYIASALSHASGIILLPILGLYLMTKNKKWYQDKLILTISAIVVLFSVFLVSVKLPIDNNLINPNSVSFNLPYDFRFQVPFLEKESDNSISEKTLGISLDSSISVDGNLFYFSCLFDYLPFVFIYLFVLAGIIIRFIKNKSYKLIYFYYIFFASLFFIALLTVRQSHKYIFCIFPIFTLLLFLEIKSTIDIISKGKLRVKYFAWGTILILTFFTATTGKFNTNFIYTSCPPCRANYHRQIISYLSKNKQEDDIIIADNPAIYYFYLGHCDYYLRQRKIKNGKNISWEALRPQDQLLFRPPAVDSVDKLRKILDDNQRVWLVGSRGNTGYEIQQYIKENMELELSSYSVSLYFSEK